MKIANRLDFILSSSWTWGKRLKSCNLTMLFWSNCELLLFSILVSNQCVQNDDTDSKSFVNFSFTLSDHIIQTRMLKAIVPSIPV